MIVVKTTVMLACNNGDFALFSSTNVQVQMHNTRSQRTIKVRAQPVEPRYQIRQQTFTNIYYCLTHGYITHPHLNKLP